MQPTTTPYPAILANTAKCLREDYAHLLRIDERALTEFLLSQKAHWQEAISADFPVLAHDHQLAPRLANSGRDWNIWLIIGVAARARPAPAPSGFAQRHSAIQVHASRSSVKLNTRRGR